ncbi:MAG: FKBP-type peptidyl-prolyl cis-trans isomerase, partial [Pseudomonas aeruginosa]|nr:FKBP-type peptidyl-prolyl cis-trans isomerase [Pseudomonas aeruginosa]
MFERPILITGGAGFIGSHLIDGKEFDNSYTRGEPLSFRLDGVIPGWTEGL